MIVELTYFQRCDRILIYKSLWNIPELWALWYQPIYIYQHFLQRKYEGSAVLQLDQMEDPVTE